MKKPTNVTVLFTLLCPGFHLPCSGRPCHPPPYLLPGCLPPGVSGSCRACEQQQGGMASRVPSTEDTRSRISNHWTDKTDFISHFTHWSISLSPLPPPSLLFPKCMFCLDLMNKTWLLSPVFLSLGELQCAVISVNFCKFFLVHFGNHISPSLLYSWDSFPKSWQILNFSTTLDLVCFTNEIIALIKWWYQSFKLPPPSSVISSFFYFLSLPHLFSIV